jgi:ATP/ADP translocase
VTVINPDVLGAFVGALLIVLNGVRVINALGWVGAAIVTVVVVVVAVVLTRVLLRRRAVRQAEDAAQSGPVDNAGAPAPGAFTTG